MAPEPQAKCADAIAWARCAAGEAHWNQPPSWSQAAWLRAASQATSELDDVAKVIATLRPVQF